jgi:hypothetical protein
MEIERQLRTVRQLSDELKPTGGFTQASLRWLIFNAKSNGFDQAIVRLGRKIYIDRERFAQWLEQQRGGQRAA